MESGNYRCVKRWDVYVDRIGQKTKEINCEGNHNASAVPLQQYTILSEGDYRPSKNITVCQFFLTLAA